MCLPYDPILKRLSLKQIEHEDRMSKLIDNNEKNRIMRNNRILIQASMFFGVIALFTFITNDFIFNNSGYGIILGWCFIVIQLTLLFVGKKKKK